MSKRPLQKQHLALLLLILGLASWWALPHLIQALPAPLRYRLPERLITLVTTPLPSALPAPTGAAPAPILIIPTPQITPPPTNTPQTVRETAVSPAPTSTSPAQSVPTQSPTATATATAVSFPPSATINGLKIVPQKFNNCGAANLTQVLNFYDVPVTQLDISDVIRPLYDDRNVSPWELVAYVNAHTSLRAATYVNGDLTLLKELLAAGFPVVIEKGLEPEGEGWMGHYLTLFGYQEATQQFRSLDSFLGPFDGQERLESYETVAQYWQHFNNRFVVIYPAERETAVSQILGSGYTNEAQMWQKSAEQAQITITHAPTDAFAWFNLGSSLTHLGQLTDQAVYFEQASIAFDEARRIGLPWRMLWYQFTPYEAYLGNGRFEDVFLLTDALLSNGGGRFVEETYLYQGHAHLAVGETDSARFSYDRGTEINPNHTALQAALAHLEKD